MTENHQTIRAASPEDLPAIRACAYAAYLKYVERIGKEPAPMIADFAAQIALGHVYVMADGPKLLGYVVFYPRADHLHLENVAVYPEHAGTGIGGRLIAFVEEHARRSGYQAVELYTNEKMFENLTLYPKLGYVEIDRRQQDSFNRVFFRKTV